MNYNGVNKTYDIPNTSIVNQNDIENNISYVQTNIIYVDQKNVQQYQTNIQQEQEQTNKFDNMCSCIKFTLLFTIMYLFYTIRSIFPIWGQLHAYHILNNWNEYCENEGLELAYYELICSSYGVYGVYLLYNMIWSKSLNAFVQLTDDQINYLGNNNSIILFIFDKYEYFGNFNIYDKKFNICKKIIGLIGLSICSFGLLTIPLIILDMYHFGNKFINQKDSMLKYLLGHMYLLISLFVFVHIINFSISNFDSDDKIDRFIARNIFGLGTVPYVIYCYYWYAFDWRFSYETNKQNIELNNNITDEEKIEQIKKLYNLYILGFFMLGIGTGGIYLYFYILYKIQNAMKFTKTEELFLYASLGLSLFIILLLKFYSFCYANRKYYQSISSENKTVWNIFLEMTNEIAIFISTCGMDYIGSTLTDIDYPLCHKKYNRAVIKTLFFAPFFLKSHINIHVRLISKFIIIIYNLILAYLATTRIDGDKKNVAIILFSLFSFPTYWIIMMTITNDYLIKKYNIAKHNIKISCMTLKYFGYCLKIKTANAFKNVKNSLKINYAETRTYLSKTKAEAHNYFHNYSNNNPRRKNGTIYNHGQLESIVEIKSYNEYNVKMIQKINSNNEKYNVLFVCNSILGKLKHIYNQKTRKHTDNYEKLWNNRFDKFIQSNFVVNEVMLNAFQFQKLNEMIQNYENTMTQIIDDLNSPHQIDQILVNNKSSIIENKNKKLISKLSQQINKSNLNNKEETFDDFLRVFEINQLY